MTASPLADEIFRHLRTHGPLPVADWMALCLGHSQHGYYTTRDPLGRAGDFVTAPEISQMFGELIGLWAAAVWQQMGSPAAVRLVELGPGRGTLMADALRAARVLPAFREALTVHLVETSPVLERCQRETLASAGAPVTWHHDLRDVPEGCAIILANEFVDALPVRQAVREADGWHERVVRLDAGDRLSLAAAPSVDPSIDEHVPDELRDAPAGAIFEWRHHPALQTLGERVVNGGAALLIDYGHTAPGLGDTLQAVRGHAFADPLEAPGEADLTAHVDFSALARHAAATGARVSGPVTQGEFLARLGIAVRAEKLKSVAPHKAPEIDAALARLTSPEKTGMGRLFKALGLGHPRLGPLPGLDRPT